MLAILAKFVLLENLVLSINRVQPETGSVVGVYKSDTDSLRSVYDNSSPIGDVDPFFNHGEVLQVYHRL